MKVESPGSDKKKAIILVALFVVLGAAGVFQFMPGGADPAPAPVKRTTAVATKPEVELPKNVGVANDLPARDPFQAPTPPPNPIQKWIDPGSAKPIQPTGPGGTLPPTGVGASTKIGGAQPGLSLQEAHPLPYSLNGLLVGEHPIAVFRDSQGHERMIRMGGFIDPEAQVTWIDKTGVTVKYRGETLHLKIGGNSVAK